MRWRKYEGLSQKRGYSIERETDWKVSSSFRGSRKEPIPELGEKVYVGD